MDCADILNEIELIKEKCLSEHRSLRSISDSVHAKIQSAHVWEQNADKEFDKITSKAVLRFEEKTQEFLWAMIAYHNTMLTTQLDRLNLLFFHFRKND